MAMALKAVTAMDPDTRKQLIGAGLGLFNSAPVVALAAAMVVNLQWNLEHIAIEKYWDSKSDPPKHKYRFRRLSTLVAADVDHKDPNKTSLAPPLMASATRLADNGLDVAASAARLAEKSIETVTAKGMFASIWEFWFGGG